MLIGAIRLRWTLPREGLTVKALLTVKASVEILAGLAIALFPSKAVWFLFGAPLEAPSGLLLGRVAGVALLTLGIACWYALQDGQSRSVAGLIAALLFYDAAVVAVFLFARFLIGTAGIALWPAMVLHSILGIWSVVCLGQARQRETRR